MKWGERYGVSEYEIKGNGSIIIVWESSGYKVSFSNRTIRNRYDNLKEAKKIGLKFAKLILEEGVAQIKEELKKNRNRGN